MKKTFAAPGSQHYPEAWHFSPVLDSGDYVFVSGVTGTRPDGSIAGTPEAQFENAFALVADNLAAAGLSFADVVEMTTYHVGLRAHLALFMAVKDRFVEPPYPAWTAIGVSELATAGALVEIRVIARRPPV